MVKNIYLYHKKSIPDHHNADGKATGTAEFDKLVWKQVITQLIFEGASTF